MSKLDILDLLSTGFEQMRNVRNAFLICAYCTTKGIVVAIHSCFREGSKLSKLHWAHAHRLRIGCEHPCKNPFDIALWDA